MTFQSAPIAEQVKSISTLFAALVLLAPQAGFAAPLPTEANPSGFDVTWTSHSNIASIDSSKRSWRMVKRCAGPLLRQR
jgi:hypothetical protein